jgi:two-component system chemotaxis response regulator CheY
MLHRAFQDTRFLVVDDVQSHRKTLVVTLQALGARVVREAGSAHEAIAQFEDHAPGVVLLDWNMPVMDGGQFVARLWDMLGERPRPHVMVVTAYPTRRTVEQCRDLGVAAVIRKPFAPRTVAEKIIGALSGRAHPDAARRDARPPAIACP